MSAFLVLVEKPPCRAVGFSHLFTGHVCKSMKKVCKTKNVTTWDLNFKCWFAAAVGSCWCHADGKQCHLEQLLICGVSLVSLQISCRSGGEVCKVRVAVHRQFELSCGPYTVSEMCCWQQELCFNPGRRMGAAGAGTGGCSRALGSPETPIPKFIPCATEKGKQYSYTLPSYSALPQQEWNFSMCLMLQESQSPPAVLAADCLL